MASSLQAHGLSSPSVIARRSCLQSASAPCSSIVRSLHDCQRSTPGYRLGALHCELIHRQLRSINLRINDRCGGQFTVDMPSLAVGARGSYETSEKPSGSQELQVVPRITQEIQKKNSQTVAASGSAAQRTLTMHAMGILLAGSLLFGVSSADAVDALRTCACLLKECRVELARCIANPACAANVACLQTCNNRIDEVECQYNYPVIEERPHGECRFRISHHSYSDCDNCWGNLWFSDRGSFMIYEATHKIGCGDLFENAVVDQFNECAVTRHNCVPRKQDEGRFPIPPAETLVEKLDPQDLTGKWYITSGLNKTFDTFDCQLHEFTGRPSNLTAKLTWRIKTPDGGFFTRSAMQNFVQDKQQPGLLANHGNEFLHYSDDWYIVSAKTDHSADDYLFVYYRGSNDAWDGYGGAVIYTRSSTLPTSIVPDLEKAAKSVGLDFNKFTTTDNTCGPEPPLLARLEKQIERGEEFIADEVEVEETFLVQGLKQVVNTVGKFLADIVNGEIKFFNNELEEARKEEEYILKQLGDEEKALLDDLNIGARDFVRLFGRPVPIRKIK